MSTATAPVRLSRPASSRQGNRWLALVLVCAAQFMVVLDATVVNVALPAIQHGLGFSAADLQWVINSYTLVFGGFLLLGGRAADLFGRRRVFVVGLAVFAGASLLDGLAQSPGMLVAGRALQGLGGALLSPAALSIITTTFDDARERTRALGVWSAIAAGGGAVGLILGGVLTQVASWPWIFYVNVPVGVGALLLTLRYVPESREHAVSRRVDVAGAVTVTAGLVALVYAIVQSQQNGWTSGSTLGLAAAGVLLLLAFVVIESRIASPLVQLRIFRNRAVVGADVVLLMVAAALFAMFFFASLYVQEVLGYGPLQAGLAFLPVTAGIVLGAGVAQAGVRMLGTRWVAIGGTAIAAVGLLLLARVTVDGGYLGVLLPGLGLMSVGMGLTFVPITLIATSSVAREDAGLASGLLNTAQQVGGALGLAVLSTIAASRTSGDLGVLHGAPSALDGQVALVDGFHLAFLVGSALTIVAAGVLAVVVRRQDTELANAAAQASGGLLPEAAR